MKDRAVIYDMDGLMIDSERLYIETEMEMARARGRTLTRETIAKMMGRKPIESLEIFRADLGLVEPASDLLAERDAKMLSLMKTDLAAMPGLFHSLEQLGSQFDLAIATGAVQKFLDLTLDTLQIRPLFRVLVPSDGIRHGKPDPEIYEKAIRELAVRAERCAVLEDSSNGCLAARRAGAYVIAVPSEHTRHQDFSPAHFIADDLFAATDHILQAIV